MVGATDSLQETQFLKGGWGPKNKDVQPPAPVMLYSQKEHDPK